MAAVQPRQTLFLHWGSAEKNELDLHEAHYSEPYLPGAFASESANAVINESAFSSVWDRVRASAKIGVYLDFPGPGFFFSPKLDSMGYGDHLLIYEISTRDGKPIQVSLEHLDGRRASEAIINGSWRSLPAVTGYRPGNDSWYVITRPPTPNENIVIRVRPPRASDSTKFAAQVMASQSLEELPDFMYKQAQYILGTWSKEIEGSTDFVVSASRKFITNFISDPEMVKSLMHLAGEKTLNEAPRRALLNYAVLAEVLTHKQSLDQSGQFLTLAEKMLLNHGASAKEMLFFNSRVRLENGAARKFETVQTFLSYLERLVDHTKNPEILKVVEPLVHEAMNLAATKNETWVVSKVLLEKISIRLQSCGSLRLRYEAE